MKRIALLTSGGDAPGMNAAVRAVVRSAVYFGIEVYGVYHGYEGLISGGDITNLSKSDVANILHRGGTILKTARSEEFRKREGREKANKVLQQKNIDGLVVIGGNGTYTGAMHLADEHDIKVIGVPGTIDNDIFGTDYSIGFDTAINTAIDAVDKIRDTADSHSRLFFIEVMGRHSGYIALHTGIGSGASAVFLPEKENSIKSLVGTLREGGRRNKLFNLVIVAEGNPNGGAQDLAAKVKQEFTDIDVRTAVIGHLQRGGSPTASDRVLASQLGYHAVDGLINGRNKVAVGIVNKEVVYTPLSDAISLKKAPNEDIIKMAEILAL